MENQQIYSNLRIDRKHIEFEEDEIDEEDYKAQLEIQDALTTAS